MDKLTEIDWSWLQKVADGRSMAAAPKSSLQRLAAMSFIVLRSHDDAFALTGLGGEAILRRKYKLDLPTWLTDLAVPGN